MMATHTQTRFWNFLPLRFAPILASWRWSLLLEVGITVPRENSLILFTSPLSTCPHESITKLRRQWYQSRIGNERHNQVIQVCHQKSRAYCKAQATAMIFASRMVSESSLPQSFFWRRTWRRIPYKISDPDRICQCMDLCGESESSVDTRDLGNFWHRQPATYRRNRNHCVEKTVFVMIYLHNIVTPWMEINVNHALT